MNYQQCIILVLACAIVVIVRSAPDWGPLPYEYFQEFYNHYGEQLQNNIDHIRHVHEAHHENQHRMHENYQEDFYDVNEQQQEGAESDHEALERSQEDQRSTGAKRKVSSRTGEIKVWNEFSVIEFFYLLKSEFLVSDLL